jgi:hypothetical protein
MRTNRARRMNRRKGFQNTNRKAKRRRKKPQQVMVLRIGKIRRTMLNLTVARSENLLEVPKETKGRELAKRKKLHAKGQEEVRVSRHRRISFADVFSTFILDTTRKYLTYSATRFLCFEKMINHARRLRRDINNPYFCTVRKSKELQPSVLTVTCYYNIPRFPI